MKNATPTLGQQLHQTAMAIHAMRRDRMCRTFRARTEWWLDSPGGRTIADSQRRGMGRNVRVPGAHTARTK